MSPSSRRWFIQQARQNDRTGGRSGRSPEAETRLGRLTEFGAWSDYFADPPPVVIVRVTPKLVEGFWKRLAREAARTQGAELPPFKDFTTSFASMRASCGSADVVPVQPFVLEHRVSEAKVVREGLYVFDPAAFAPPCARVTLSIHAEKASEKGDTVTIDAGTPPDPARPIITLALELGRRERRLCSIEPGTGVYFRLRGSASVGSSVKEKPMGSKRPARQGIPEKRRGVGRWFHPGSGSTRDRPDTHGSSPPMIRGDEDEIRSPTAIAPSM